MKDQELQAREVQAAARPAQGAGCDEPARAPVSLPPASAPALVLALRRVEHRDWWLWWTAITVMLLLTAAIVSQSLPTLLKQEEDAFFKFHLNQSVRGLIGLTLLFNVYVVFQQILIKRLRRQTVDQIRVISRLETRTEELYKLAVHDPLTALLNRRFAEQYLVAELARSRRHKRPLTLLILDLDEFKQINDRYGHTAGDLVLKEFARSLKAAIRSSDLPVRLGGDEFLVLLPECPAEHIQEVLARLSRLKVQVQGQTIPVSSSAGWAQHIPGETPEQLLERADQALYASKRGKTAAPVP